MPPRFRSSAFARAIPVLAVAALAACTAGPQPDGTYAVACHADDARPAETALQILGPDSYRVGGWSHVNGVGAFATVAQPPAAYRITAENYVEDDTCGGARTLGVLFARKTYDWDREHANGIEAKFGTDGLAFGEVTDVVLELRLRPDVTSIPTGEDLAAAYGDLLTQAQLEALDDGTVDLEVTLFGTGATADQPFMNAGAWISLDPAEYADGWVRIQIPRDRMTFYTEDNYVRTEAGPDAFRDLAVAGLRINPETSSGLSVRHFIPDDFDPAAKPELFKEMGVAFALIEIGRTPEGTP